MDDSSDSSMASMTDSSPLSSQERSGSNKTSSKKCAKKFEMHTPPFNWQMLFKKRRSMKPSPSSKKAATTSSTLNPLPRYQTKADLFSNLNDYDEDMDFSSSKKEYEAVKVPISEFLLPMPSEIPDRILRPLRRTPVFDLENLDETDKRYYFYSEPTVVSPHIKECLEKAAEIKKRMERKESDASLPAAVSVQPTCAPIPRDDLMKGVVVFVDVRYKKRKCSAVIGDHVKKMGAIVRSTFTNDVTHVIFNNGLYSVYKKATERNLPLVGLTWVEKSKEANVLLPVEDFIAKSKAFYDDPNTLKPYQRRKDWSPTHQAKLQKQREQRERRKEKKLEEERRLQLALQQEEEEKTSESEPEPDDPELRKLTYDVLYNSSFTRRTRKWIANRENSAEGEAKSFCDFSFDEDEIEEEKAQMAILEERQAEFEEVKKAYAERKREHEKRKSLKLARKAESSSTPDYSRSTTPPRSTKKKLAGTKTTQKRSSSKKHEEYSPSSSTPTSTKQFNKKSNKAKNEKKTENKSFDNCKELTTPKLSAILNYRSSNLDSTPETNVRRSIRHGGILSTPELCSSNGKFSTPEPATTQSSTKTSLETSPESDYEADTKKISVKRKRAGNDNLDLMASKKNKKMADSESPRRSLRRSIRKLSIHSSTAVASDEESEMPAEPKIKKMKFTCLPLEAGQDLYSLGVVQDTVDSSDIKAKKIAGNLTKYKLNPLIYAPSTTTSCGSVDSLEQTALNVTNESLKNFLMENKSKNSEEAMSSGTSDFGVLLEGQIEDMVANSNECKKMQVDKQIKDPVKDCDPDLDLDTGEESLQIPSTSKDSVNLNDSLANFTICQPTRSSVKPRKSVRMKCIVCTSLDSKQFALLQKAVEKMGSFMLSKTLSDKVTHVVCGEPKRTLTVMHGILNGCWILDFQWVEWSLANGSWLCEDQFLTLRFREATKKGMALSLSSLNCQLFECCGLLYVTANTSPPPRDLMKLLKKAGANVTFSAALASVIVGRKSDLKLSYNLVSQNVSEQWVLDSVAALELQPLENYLY